MKMRTSILFLALPIMLSACAMADIEDLVTIEQGVYGQCSVEDDVGPEFYPCDTGKLFAVFLGQPGARGTSVMLDAAVGRTNSGSDGFYQIALEPGSYGLCHVVDASEDPFVIACIEVEVHESRAARYDYTFGLISEFTSR